MYLTQILLNDKNQKVIKALTNVNEMHKLVMSGFRSVDVDSARKELGVLFQIYIKKNRPYVIIQSFEKADYSKLIDNNIILSVKEKDFDEILNLLKKDGVIKLELLSEPYKKVKNLNSHNSRRKVLTDKEEKAEWFNSKIKQCGCDVIEYDVSKTNLCIYGNKKKLNFKYHPSVYKAIVKINDENKFTDMIKSGIGSGKAYGMGMIRIFLRF